MVKERLSVVCLHVVVVVVVVVDTKAKQKKMKMKKDVNQVKGWVVCLRMSLR